MYPEFRPRRLRTTPAMRRLVAETSLEPRHLVLPMFVADGIGAPREISSMPGVFQHTFDSLRAAATAADEAGVGGLMLFGVPRAEDKDARGSGATDPDEQQKLWRLLMYRELPAPTIEFRFKIFINDRILPYYNEVRYGQ